MKPRVADPGFSVQVREENSCLDQADRIYADVSHGAGIDRAVGEQAVCSV